MLEKKKKNKIKKQKRLEKESEFLRVSILNTVRAIFVAGTFIGGIFSGSLAILTGCLIILFELLQFSIQSI